MSAGATVVICTWAGDEPAISLGTIAAAARQGPVVVVDMTPDRALIASQASAIAGVRVVHVPGSSGLGESRARGLAETDSRRVAFLDSDAVPRPGWLAALERAVAEEDVAVAGGPVLPLWPPGTRVPRLFRTTSAGDFLSMLDLGHERLDVPRVLPGNMLIDRELTGEEVFDPLRGRTRGSLVGAEEIAMMLDVARRGLRLVYVPEAAVDHHTRAERMSWRWMWQRAEAAGREDAVTDERLAPMPRRMSAADQLFRAAVAIPFLRGRRRAGS